MVYLIVFDVRERRYIQYTKSYLTVDGDDMVYIIIFDGRRRRYE